MRYGPRKHRRDSNHNEIVRALESPEIGCRCLDLSQLGHGCPDVLVSRLGQMWLMEFKSGKQKRTKDQEDWDERWQAPVYVVNSVEAALETVLGRNPQYFDKANC